MIHKFEALTCWELAFEAVARQGKARQDKARQGKARQGLGCARADQVRTARTCSVGGQAVVLCKKQGRSLHELPPSPVGSCCNVATLI